MKFVVDYFGSLMPSAASKEDLKAFVELLLIRISRSTQNDLEMKRARPRKSS